MERKNYQAFLRKKYYANTFRIIFFVFTASPSKITFLEILHRCFSFLDIFKNVHFQKLTLLYFPIFYFSKSKTI